jgi:hypothetical protein
MAEAGSQGGGTDGEQCRPGGCPTSGWTESKGEASSRCRQDAKWQHIAKASRSSGIATSSFGYVSGSQMVIPSYNSLPLHFSSSTLRVKICDARESCWCRSRHRRAVGNIRQEGERESYHALGTLTHLSITAVTPDVLLHEAGDISS